MPSKLIIPEAIELVQIASDPAAVAGKAQIYSKVDGGVSQLFGRSDDGTVHQITPAGAGSGDGTTSMFNDLLSGTDGLWLYRFGANSFAAARRPANNEIAMGIVRLSGVFFGGEAKLVWAGGQEGFVQPNDTPCGSFRLNEDHEFTWEIRAKANQINANNLDKFDMMVGPLVWNSSPGGVNQGAPHFTLSRGFFSNGNWWVFTDDFSLPGNFQGFIDTGVAGDTAWHRFGGTFDGTTYRWYIDGVQVFSAPAVGSHVGSEINFGIAINPVDQNSSADMDYIKIEYPLNQA